MMVLAPASAKASTQASPMPWPPPVTSAVRPWSLNFSRYMRLPSRWEASALRSLRRRPSGPDCLAVLVEAVEMGGIGREAHIVAGRDAELAHAARRQGA